MTQINLYRKPQPPSDEKSHYEYLEQQFRELETAFQQMQTKITEVEGLAYRTITIGATEKPDVVAFTVPATWIAQLLVTESKDTLSANGLIQLAVLAATENRDTFDGFIPTSVQLAAIETGDILSGFVETPIRQIQLFAAESRDIRAAREKRDSIIATCRNSAVTTNPVAVRAGWFDYRTREEPLAEKSDTFVSTLT